MWIKILLFSGAFLFTCDVSSTTHIIQLQPLPHSNCSISHEILPDFCKQFFTNVTFWVRLSNETLLNSEALESVNINVLSNISFNGTLMQRHLCYYYFPLCDTQTDDVIAVCNGSCQTLNDNPVYSVVINEVAKGLNSFGIEPPDDKCFKTFSEHSNNVSISQFCVRTEDIDASVEDSIGLSCIPIPSEDPCSGILNQTHYTPNVTEITENNFRNIITLIAAIEISESCETLSSVLLCAYSFPACDFNTSQLLPICSERCEVIDELFAICRQFVSNETLQLIPVLRPLLEMFNCSNPLTYFSVLPKLISETNCNNLVGDNVITLPAPVADNSDGGDKLSASVIAGIVTGTVALLSIIIIIVIIVFKKFVFTQPMHQDKEMNGNCTMVSMSSSQSSQPRETNCDCQKETMTSDEIDQFLQMTKKTFSDVLFPKEYITKQDFLGEGAFGVVHKGEFVDVDGAMMPVAIKTIKSSNLDSLRELVAETAIMKHFNHPNVLQLFGVCVDISNMDGSMLQVILPFMSNGDLRSFLRKNRVEETDIKHYPKDIDKFGLIRMCVDIAKGMEYLSMKRFVHRDLAARNCMVDMHLNIRVADFGLTRDIYSTEYYRVDKHIKLPLKWMAIESILDGYFNEKTDMWSYGVTCWEVFSLGRIPYPGILNHNVITILQNGRRLTKPTLCPPKLYNLIQLTWLENPAERPTFAEIVYKLNQSAIF